MKWAPHVLATLLFLAVSILVMNAVGTYPAQAYTRDVSGSDSKAILVALEALITDAAALEVDVAALEVDLAAIEVINTAIKTALEKMDDASGSGLTYTRVKIDQGSAGRATLLAGVTGKTARLHALVGTMGATGTVQIFYDDDGSGTSEAALTGDMDVAATGGMVIPFNRDPAAALATAVAKYLTIITTGGDFNGYAVVSTD